MLTPVNEHDPVVTARECWGEDAPEWIMHLAAECGRSSRNKVAQRLEVSLTMISNTLRNKYPGNLDRLRALFEGVYLSAVVMCPAKGEIASNVCQTWRDRSRQFSSVNSERVQMYRACNKCPRNEKGGQE